MSIRTMETTIGAASKVAEDWFYELKARVRRGGQLHEPLFSDIVREFLVDPSIQGGVSAGTHGNYAKKWNVLEPLFRDVRVSAVTLDKLEDVRNTRAAGTNRYGTPSPQTPSTKTSRSSVRSCGGELRENLSQSPFHPLRNARVDSKSSNTVVPPSV